eukprot:14652901-Alexandrium_andersonii.AAC.1
MCSKHRRAATAAKARSNASIERHTFHAVPTTNTKRFKAAKFHRPSTVGKYRLGMRRNLGHASQEATARMLDASCGRRAVGASEHLLAANLLGRERAWHQQWQTALNSTSANSYEIHSFRGDVPMPVQSSCDCVSVC